MVILLFDVNSGQIRIGARFPANLREIGAISMKNKPMGNHIESLH
mgnify:CR=1 FL=1